MGPGAKPLVGGQGPQEYIYFDIYINYYYGYILKLEVHNPQGVCDHFCQN